MTLYRTKASFTKILLSKQTASSEVNLLPNKGYSLSSSIGEISSGSIHRTSNISSQLATDSSKVSKCQVSSEIQPQLHQPCSLRTVKRTNFYVNPSVSAEKGLTKAPLNRLIHAEGTVDIRTAVAKEKAGVHQRSPSSLFCPRPVFSPGELYLETSQGEREIFCYDIDLFLFPGDFSDPRPPEEADLIAEMTKSQCLDTSLLDNDPVTSDLLMQLFLSDLTPEEELNKLGGVSSSIAPPTSMDVDREMSAVSTASTPTSSLATVPQLPSPEPLVQSDSGACSEAPSPFGTLTNDATCDDIISTFMLSASPLECNDTSGFTDPLDNPFLTESTDFSDFLQDPCVLNNVSTMLTSINTTTSSSNNACSSPSFSLNVLPEFCSSPSPVGSNTDVHVNVTDTQTQDDISLFDLSHTPSIVPSFATAEVENLDIDFSAFCTDTLSLVPGSPDELTTDQLSVMLTQAQPQSASEHELNRSQATGSSSDEGFIESSPSPSASDQLSVQDNPVESPASNISRKRTASDVESDANDVIISAPDAKKTKLNRRQKNNVASQVSRAKRKAKNVAIFDRVGELESENAMLRIKEKELATEIERLKKLLVTRLSQ